MLLCSITLLTLVAGATADTNFLPDSPTQWTTAAGGNGHYYQPVIAPNGIDWERANTYATQHGGYLATITSAEEDAFVFHLTDDAKYWVNNANSNGPWLGGWKSPLSSSPGNGWEWVNHEGEFKYTGWGSGQPDNTGGIENRIHYFVFGQNSRAPTWNDGPDTYANRSFVVEYDTNPAKPSPAKSAAIFQPPAEIHSVELTEWRADAGGNGHFYEAVESPAGITWNDAETYATAHNGYLATIASKEENAFVFKLVDEAGFWMNSPQGDSWGPWLGGAKQQTTANPKDGWTWSHNDGAFTFTNWNRTQPDNRGGREDRLNFYGEGKNNRQPEWADLDGNTPLRGFVVEYDGNPLPTSLPYVALFGVCVVGAIAVGSIIYFIFWGWKKPDESGTPEG